MAILEIYGRGKVIDEFKNDSALKKFNIVLGRVRC